eukprot:SAG22_NODE_497_length_9790_cov_3.684178_4_plen_210_part_00
MPSTAAAGDAQQPASSSGAATDREGETGGRDGAAKRPPSSAPVLHLLVGGAVGWAVLFEDILSQWQPRPLPGMDPDTDLEGSDAVLCVDVAASQADGGGSRLLVGTHGKKLLVYSCHARASPGLSCGGTETAAAARGGLTFSIERTYTFDEPVVAVRTADIIGDGVLELVVLTSYCCHVLQPHPDAIRHRLSLGLKAISNALIAGLPPG